MHYDKHELEDNTKIAQGTLAALTWNSNPILHGGAFHHRTNHPEMTLYHRRRWTQEKQPKYGIKQFKKEHQIGTIKKK